MKAIVKFVMFVLSALRAGRLCVDVDGTLVASFVVPQEIPYEQRLAWWMENLQPTKVQWDRISILVLLKALGVDLVVWTNRGVAHEAVTKANLSKVCWLFSSWEFYGGKKSSSNPTCPTLDDEDKYVLNGGLKVAKR